jgi:hypothetical protein
MPVPPIPTAYASGTQTCSSQSFNLSATAIATTLATADCTELGPFVSALETALNCADSDQLKALSARLGTISEFNPDGFDPVMTSLLSTVATADLKDVVLKWFTEVFPQLHFAPSITFASSGPCQFSISYEPLANPDGSPAMGNIHLDIVITPDCLPAAGGGGTTDTTIVSVSVPQCDGTVLAIPIPTLTETDSGGVVRVAATATQQILNMLSLLLKCCDPCALSDWNYGDPYTNTLQLRPAMGIAMFGHDIIENLEPARIDWQPPIDPLTGGVQRFGKLIFIYEGSRAGELEFINYANQQWRPKLPGCIGVDLFLNDGVKAIPQWQTQPAFNGTL